MFERYLTDALTTHFGHFVQNLDSEKVRLSAWHGELVLEDLLLRQNALDRFMGGQECPVEIVWGRIGHLEARIPWKLRSANASWSTNCSVVLSNVNIIIAPKQRMKAESTSESEPRASTETTDTPKLSLEEKRQRKEEQVQQELDASLFRQRIAGSDNNEATLSRRDRWIRWARAFVTNLLSTLSVTVRDIHIRYEDPGTCLGFVPNVNGPHRPPFAVGVTLRQFAIQTAAQGSKPHEIKSATDIITPSESRMRHKIVAAYQLAVYWDTGCQLVTTNAHIIHKLKQRLDDEETWTEDKYYATAFAVLNNTGGYSFFHRKRYSQKHSYLLNPVSPALHISLAGTSAPTDPSTSHISTSQQTEKEKETPEPGTSPRPSTLVLIAPPCHFVIARSTLQDMVYIRKSLSIWRQSQKAKRHESTLRRLTQLRPSVSPRGNPQLWWRYAVEATVLLTKLTTQHSGEGRRKRGWLSLAEALRKRRAYVGYYRQILSESSNTDEKQIAHEALLKMEDDLLLSEIVAFRIAVHSTHTNTEVRVKSGEGSSDTGAGGGSEKRDSGVAQKGGPLSWEHRIAMYTEMKEFLDEEKDREKSSMDVSFHAETESTLRSDGANQCPILWQASFDFPELALQVNDQLVTSDSMPLGKGSAFPLEATPIVRLSCASAQRFLYRRRGSWEFECSVASLELKELSVESGYIFHNLIGAKSNERDTDKPSVIQIGGASHRHCASVVVKRSIYDDGADCLDADYPFGSIGTVTQTEVRVSSLEIVYATKPVEALVRVFSEVNCPETVDDYYRMTSVLLDWRRRQQKRLLNALAHRRKKILVDIDVVAPVILVPEVLNKRGCSLLTIDLGRLQFRSLPNVESCTPTSDTWGLHLSDLQVLCSSTSMYEHEAPSTASKEEKPGSSAYSSVQQMVEPFSLDFNISTKLGKDGSADEKLQIRISATLPRLVFNLTTSAVRLVLRLQLQWSKRRAQASIAGAGTSPPPRHTFSTATAYEVPNTADGVDRGVEFCFSAPLIVFKMENDVDGRRWRPSNLETAPPTRNHAVPLVHLAFRGIRGSFLQVISRDKEKTNTIEATLRSVDAVDLYQTAGCDFALLLSSTPPDTLYNALLEMEAGSWERFYDLYDVEIVEDLVSVHCRSWGNVPSSVDKCRAPTTIAIRFHELYMEWNPETLAAVQKSLRLPPVAEYCETQEEISVSQEEFFDAVEDCADEDSFGDSEAFLISEVSTSGLSSYSEDEPTSPFRAMPTVSSLWSPCPASIPSLSHFSPLQLGDEQLYASQFNRECNFKEQLEVSFSLSKLRINFNKESRHRRLLIAEMDGTDVRYHKFKSRGSKALAKIDNLTFSDPSAIEGSSLYKQILGLKLEPSASGKPTSLLEMEFELRPRRRKRLCFNAEYDAGEGPKQNEECVIVDAEKGLLFGSDNIVTLKLSPMRFVVLEQLWLEVIDYFFVGVLGDAVWGRHLGSKELIKTTNDQDSIGPFDPPSNLLGADASSFVVTRFDVHMDSPTVLLPVSYRSPQYLRLEFSKAVYSNRYSGCVEENPDPRMQWYNNGILSLRDVKLVSWCGTELSSPRNASSSSGQMTSSNTIDATVYIKWPLGPTAPQVLPKWNVTCDVDDLDIILRKVDYALLQNIVSRNIGEPPRHLKEWNTLQNLPVSELNEYKQRIIVHFGYDKKDSLPTTYAITIDVGVVRCFLSEKSESSSWDSNLVLEATCSELRFLMKKHKDRISRQKIVCDIVLRKPETHAVLLKSSFHESSDIPELCYTSTTSPSSDNVKTLKVNGACIFAIPSAWGKVQNFFRNVPAPKILSREGIMSSIQIGDRWYRMGTERDDEVQEDISAENENQFSISGKRASFQFHLILKSPRIICGADPELSRDVNVKSSSVILSLSHLEFLRVNDCFNGKLRRSILVHDLELYTAAKQAPFESTEASLIRPWCIAALDEGGNSSCEEHKITICADSLRSRVAYSDVSTAFDVFRQFADDLRAFRKEHHISASSDPSQNPETIHRRIDRPSRDGEKTDTTGSLSAMANLCVTSDGLEVLVVDDSGRHFAGAQALTLFSIGCISFSRTRRSQEHDVYVPSDAENVSSDLRPAVFTSFQIASIIMLDCLQQPESKFRVIATSHVSPSEGRNMSDADVGVVDGTQHNHTTPRSFKMKWTDFCCVRDEIWGFIESPSFLERVRWAWQGEVASDLSTASKRSGEKPVDSFKLVEVTVKSDVSTQCDVKLRSFKLQWNPSTVIALQRFLGRLKKEAKAKFATVEHAQPQNASVAQYRETAVGTSATVVDVSFESLSLYLNKEHQNRRVLEASVKGTKLLLECKNGIVCLNASVNDFGAWDPDDYASRRSLGIQPSNRELVHVIDGERGDKMEKQFLKVRYKTFWESSPRQHLGVLPDWVLSHGDPTPANIDDFLSISIASLRLTYVRERTEEILDYLSNGLPGKGMGATSRAAKTFINKRIQTRSFLQLDVRAPQIVIPRHENSRSGVVLRLGDVGVKSWFEGRVNVTQSDSDLSDRPNEWWRVLTVSALGIGCSMLEEQAPRDRDVTKKELVDLQLTLRKPTWYERTISIRGDLTSLDLALKYTDYLLLRAVLRENVGRDIDTTCWDNVEKAYGLETGNLERNDDNEFAGDVSATHHHASNADHIAYASGARFIRYGKKTEIRRLCPGNKFTKEGPAKNAPLQLETTERILDLKINLKGVSATLCRDDAIDEDLNYDVVLFRVQFLEMVVSTNSIGEKSFHLSLYRLILVDLGDVGRCRRDLLAYGASESVGTTKSCAFCILAEGHSTGNERKEQQSLEPSESEDPELRLSLSQGTKSLSDATGDVATKVTELQLVVNHLSLNALIRPLREVVSFLTCSWPSERVAGIDDTTPYFLAEHCAAVPDGNALNSSFQVKLVAHYPRVFFVADETEHHSKALVLRGLAVVNTRIEKHSLPLKYIEGDTASRDVEVTRTIDAHFHNIESYVNADVGDTLGVKSRHLTMLPAGTAFRVASFVTPEEKEEVAEESSLGIALMKPVSAGLECCQTDRDDFPTERSASLHMESVSVMFSFEDLTLFRAVIQRWSGRVAAKDGGDALSKKKEVSGRDCGVDHRLYTLELHSGRPSGLIIEKSTCGDFPIIVAVSRTLLGASLKSNSSPSENLQPIAYPKCGAAIVRFNGEITTESGFDEVLSQLLVAETADPSDASPPISDSTYTITLLEMCSWGNHDKLNVTVKAVRVTFIDDFRGRDMPMFRCNLKSSEINWERGLGIVNHASGDAESISFPERPPLATNNTSDQTPEGGGPPRFFYRVDVLVKPQIDYYHPRNSVWEPLLESCQLSMFLEQYSATESSPRCLSLVLSDGVLCEEMSAASSYSRPTCIDISDSASEVVLRSIAEWKQWREGNDNSGQNLNGTSSTRKSNTSSETGTSRTYRRKEKKIESTRITAEAALSFAQKRGANKQNTRDSAKPFVFRNRTGMRIAFAQENGAGIVATGEEGSPFSQRFLGSDFVEVEDGKDMRFDLHFLVQGTQSSLRPRGLAIPEGTTKIRASDGQLPLLVVALENASGMKSDFIRGLPVSKAGSFTRSIRIVISGRAPSVVRVVWRVDIKDNRRIITLSSAVRIISLGLATDVGVGIKCTNATLDGMPFEREKKGGIETDASIRCIGYAKPGLPFYLPLWISIQCEQVSVFLTPIAGKREDMHTLEASESNQLNAKFCWGGKSVLEFCRNGDEYTHREDLANARGEERQWEWRATFDPVCSVRCDVVNKVEFAFPAAYLSCYLSHQMSDTVATGKYISISVDAGVTLRNLLPLSLDWEIAHRPSKHSAAVRLDGSTMRKEVLEEDRGALSCSVSDPMLEEKCLLASGNYAEVFSCDVSFMNIYLRCRCNSLQSWSEWEPLTDCSSNNDVHGSSSDSSHNLSEKPSSECPRQTNVQLKDEFGTPLTLGVRIFAKPLKEVLHHSLLGIYVVIYADIWLRNSTGLPLSFGCPSSQLFSIPNGTSAKREDEKDKGDEKVAAETTLREIASVLELGDKGKVLNHPLQNGASVQGDLYFLPFQSSPICEEVFEYIETESSTVKRRWWASENHGNCREKPSSFPEQGSDWRWIDSTWMIDCTGQAKEHEGGWESCRNLVGETGSTFSLTRTFNPIHRFRRRRWFRRRVPCASGGDSFVSESGFLRGGLCAFHQPVVDASSKTQQKHSRQVYGGSDSQDDAGRSSSFDRNSSRSIEIGVKCGDGQWSVAVTPEQGAGYGFVRVFSSRWPTLTKISQGVQKDDVSTPAGALLTTETSSSGLSDGNRLCFKPGNLKPMVHDLVYQLSDLRGEWDDFSRLMVLTPRFLVRNDSKSLTFEVKQVGAANDTASAVGPGQVVPFYWSDMRLPELVSARPLFDRPDGTRFFRWSGGIDICSLGMTAIRVRPSRKPSTSATALNTKDDDDTLKLRSLKSVVEIRSGTGGIGINISFKEEDRKGNGSLFRVENLSPFPIWVAQDGVLANPASTLRNSSSLFPGDMARDSSRDDHAEVDGDLVPSMSQIPYALDVPYRQGKYTGRKAATMTELLRVRAALAPLSSREGIESTKVIGFGNVGWCVRLNPTKLTSTLDDAMVRDLNNVRVLGVITTDGPTRVLRFSLMEKRDSDNVFAGAVHRKAPYYGASSAIGYANQQTTVNAAVHTIALAKANRLVSEEEAKNLCFSGTGLDKFIDHSDNHVVERTQAREHGKDDVYFRFRASFGSFVLSLIDSAPSEIAVATLRDVNVVANGNLARSDDASAIISVGWLQVDNHIPNAPFPVAICPEEPVQNGENDEYVSPDAVSSPLLLVGLEFAPKHKSGILCLRSATISPSNLAIAIDLATIVRFLNFVNCIKNHATDIMAEAETSEALMGLLALDVQYEKLPTFPDLESIYCMLEDAGKADVKRQKIYFEGLKILPYKIRLSVAPSRALSPAQAAVEGPEAAAIHTAVRRGDLLIGDEGSVLGVHVGGRNKTAIAVVRGVFKSILVDAILRCDGASMKFPGVVLRNHISSGSQLKTFLAAHYLASLRKNLPSLIGSLAAFGNPLGLIRGLGDGVSDFVNEPVKGLKKSVKELDPTFVVDGVARGTESLARHTVSGFADSAALLAETLARNMTIMTLDRRYAQRRDRKIAPRSERENTTTFVEGIESGVAKLVRGVLEGVTGVVKAPLRGAEKRGVEGFAKGIGKGLLGLLVKPMIGISDAATDVMLGVKGSIDGGGKTLQRTGIHREQVRPRRPLYGHNSLLRPYNLADAAACALMMRTRLAGEKYWNHFDLEDRVVLLSVKRLLMLGQGGEELLLVSYGDVIDAKVHQSNIDAEGNAEWRILIFLKDPSNSGNVVERITCKDEDQALELCGAIKQGIRLYVDDVLCHTAEVFDLLFLLRRQTKAYLELGEAFVKARKEVSKNDEFPSRVFEPPGTPRSKSEIQTLLTQKRLIDWEGRLSSTYGIDGECRNNFVEE